MNIKIISVTSIIAVSMMIAMTFAGCGKKQPAGEQTGMPAATPSDGPGKAAEAPAPEKTEPSPQQPQTEKPKIFGDIMGRFDIPKSFQMTVEMPEGQMPQGAKETTMVMKMQDYTPAKMKLQHEKGVMLFDYEKKQMYMWQPGSKQGMKMPLTMAKQKTEKGKKDVPTNPYVSYEPDHKIVGSETVDGVNCWIVETTDDDDEEEGADRLWIGKKDGLARQAKTEDRLTKMKYSRINEVSDSEFQVPDDVQIRQMPAVPDFGG